MFFVLLIVVTWCVGVTCLLLQEAGKGGGQPSGSKGQSSRGESVRPDASGVTQVAGSAAEDTSAPPAPEV